MPYINVGKVTEELNELAGNKVEKGHEVIEFQAPTAKNNYTWYRKYADGWVEQGGLFTNADNVKETSIIFPVIMSDNNYFAMSSVNFGSTGWSATVTSCIKGSSKTENGMVVINYYNSSAIGGLTSWEVKGMYAQ